MNLVNLTYQGLTKYARSDRLPFQGSGFGSLRMSKFEPDLLELCRSGRLYVASTSIATNGQASVQDVPTTTASFSLYNNSAGKYLTPLRMGAFNSGGTTGAGFTLLAGVTPLPLATPAVANGTGHTVGSLRGGTVGNLVFLATAVTVPTMAANFVAVGGIETAADATVGCGAVFDVAGMFIVPYGYSLAAAVLSGAGTSPKYGISVVFALLELDLDG